MHGGGVEGEEKCELWNLIDCLSFIWPFTPPLCNMVLLSPFVIDYMNAFAWIWDQHTWVLFAGTLLQQAGEKKKLIKPVIMVHCSHPTMLPSPARDVLKKCFCNHFLKPVLLAHIVLWAHCTLLYMTEVNIKRVRGWCEEFCRPIIPVVFR